nr:hypothetical protein [Tanacetum cinerariifolium]
MNVIITLKDRLVEDDEEEEEKEKKRWWSSRVVVVEQSSGDGRAVERWSWSSRAVMVSPESGKKIMVRKVRNVGGVSTTVEIVMNVIITLKDRLRWWSSRVVVVEQSSGDGRAVEQWSWSSRAVMVSPESGKKLW